MSNQITVTSNTKKLCYICQIDKPDEPIKKFCDCPYHHECLKQFVNVKQKSSCPICKRIFTNCKIIKQNRRFCDFLCNNEICTLLAFFILIIFYSFQIFIIIFTEYSISTSCISKFVQIVILILGLFYCLAFLSAKGIGIAIFRNQYTVWCEQNYTLQML